MIQATRRWFRRNRTNFAIGAGVLGAGYVAGQYVLGKLGEARQRMSDERIAKEKYALPPCTPQLSANTAPVCAAVSSRTRKTALLPSSPFCPPPPRTFSTPSPSNKCSRNCRSRRQSALPEAWAPARLRAQPHLALQTPPRMTPEVRAYRQTATSTQVRSSLRAMAARLQSRLHRLAMRGGVGGARHSSGVR